MTGKIEPALTAEEWADLPDAYALCAEWDGNERKIIALANDSLADSDPRKITRRHAELLRVVAGLAERYVKTLAAIKSLRPIKADLDVEIKKTLDVAVPANAERAKDEMLVLADVLESYLPPA